MKKATVGRTILSAAAGLTAAGGFVSDLNKTHMFNPKWTPHAKFHDGMTILLGAMLGASSLYLLQKKNGNQKKNLLWSTMLPSFFWASMAGSFAFPGAKGIDAEFPEKVRSVKGVALNEGPVSALMLSVLGLGYALAKKRKKK